MRRGAGQRRKRRLSIDRVLVPIQPAGGTGGGYKRNIRNIRGQAHGSAGGRDGAVRRSDPAVRCQGGAALRRSRGPGALPDGDFRRRAAMSPQLLPRTMVASRDFRAFEAAWLAVIDPWTAAH